MNAAGRSHNTANNATGKPSRARKPCRLISSRAMNGRMRIELMIAGDRMAVKAVFIDAHLGDSAYHMMLTQR